MAVRAPLFSEYLGFQDSMLDSSGYGLPDPFANLIEPFQVSEPASAELFDFQPLNAEFERQSREIDLFLHLQSERLKYAIQEQKRQQISAMLRSLESNTSAVIRKAEHDLAEARSRTRELEGCLRRAEMETESWERAAKENEAMILGLNNMLGQAQETLNWASSQAQGAESASEIGGGAEGDKMSCKWCRKKISSVVLLPCRHLCACRECGSLLEMCPVCQSIKQGVIEVFLNQGEN